MGIKRRAIDPAQKQVRRALILDTTRQIFATNGYAAITMAEVAAQAGLAKGTLYLYFATKEELFLALLEQQLSAWFADMQAGMAELRGSGAAAEVAQVIVAGLQREPDMVRLLAILHGVLEQNISLERAQLFKRTLADGLAQLSLQLHAALPQLVAGSGEARLLRIYALIIGLQQLADPAPSARAAIDADAQLRVFDIHFADELLAGASAILAAE